MLTTTDIIEDIKRQPWYKREMQKARNEAMKEFNKRIPIIEAEAKKELMREIERIRDLKDTNQMALEWSELRQRDLSKSSLEKPKVNNYDNTKPKKAKFV